LLNCGRNTVYNLVNNNELTLIKMGRRSLIVNTGLKLTPFGAFSPV